MVSCSVRDLRSSKQVQPRWCDVVYNEHENRIYLQKKDKNSKRIESILLDDFEYQVNAFIQELKKSV